MTQELNKEALLPCPFCGGDAKTYRPSTRDLDGHMACCKECHIDMWEETKEAAIKRWNTRSHPKVTGFESEIAEWNQHLDDIAPLCKKYNHEPERREQIRFLLLINAESLIRRMQAALAGGGHD